MIILIKRLLLLFFIFISTQIAWSGVIYQNFEDNNALPINVWSVGGAGVSVVDRSEAAYSGNKSLKMSSTAYWAGVGVGARPNIYLDIKQINNDRLSFWIFAKPVRLCYIYGCAAGTNNTVGVRLYDNGTYKTNGFEVWTTQTANFAQWSKLKVLFSQLPSNFNLRQVTKIEFKQYMPGNYYIDDIQVAREDRAYQTFEKEERAGSADSEYGWKWNDADTSVFSAEGEPAHSGAHSWKLTTVLKWSGTGIQSQDKRLITTTTGTDQSFWNVDLAPEINDRLNFWVYALPGNGMDNNISIQLYDNKNHSTDATKVAVWPKKAATSGQWTRITVLFSEIRAQASDFDFKNINKIQFQSYWPGTFYIDDIVASGPIPYVTQNTTTGVLNWSSAGVNKKYRLQASPTGKEGTWKTIYVGTAISFARQNTTINFFRVRWEEDALDAITIPYVSPWSETFEYLPLSVVLSYSQLRVGKLIWSATPLNNAYQIQQASSVFGPWTLFYQGPVVTTLLATKGMWYRIRGIQQNNNVMVGFTSWSRPQTYNPWIGYVKANGKVLKDNDGKGNVLVLNGVNLGGSLVNEPWMTGVGKADTPTLDDDWSIRNQLSVRFTPTEVNALQTNYQNAYLNAYDLDYLLKLGVTVVRLPFWYRNLQDDNGNWILNTAGQIDFFPLDRLINGFADRGIYVLLDLHGAPGLQSADANTGRKGFNKLFAGDGEIYRQRTITLWTEVAKRYKSNTWILGYDLLNEPVGAAPSTYALADLYDRIYKAIRAADPYHLIMMEGIWFSDATTKKEIVDWATLPYPSVRNWTNVLYQFHFYHWNDVDANGNVINTDENYASHKVFIDQKIAQAKISQPLYNVPVMVGEFYGFGIKSIWDYYIQAFNAQQWSWTTWSYKYHDSPQNWGLVNHVGYNEALPKIATDSYTDLNRKFSKYTTHFYHKPNVALQQVFSSSLVSTMNYPANIPYSIGVSDLFIEPGKELTINGKNFGAFNNSSQVLYQGAGLPINQWSGTVGIGTWSTNVGVGSTWPGMTLGVQDKIRVTIPTTIGPGSGPVVVKTSQGTSNAVDIMVTAHDSSLDPQPSTATGYQLPDVFMDTFVRCNGQPLGTHGCV